MLTKSSLWTTLLLGTAIELVAKVCTSNGEETTPHEPSDLTWTGAIEENGDPVTITGSSLQHIEARIREIKPDFSWSNKAEPSSHDSLRRTEGDILCQLSWNPSYASVFHINQGIDYLHKIKGNCAIGPGPANCSRVSCSYGSGIWFCNDNTHPIGVPCSTLGDRAFDIVEKCYAYGDDPIDLVLGQVFDTDNWNVMVIGSDC